MVNEATKKTTHRASAVQRLLFCLRRSGTSGDDESIRYNLMLLRLNSLESQPSNSQSRSQAWNSDHLTVLHYRRSSAKVSSTLSASSRGWPAHQWSSPVASRFSWLELHGLLLLHVWTPCWSFVHSACDTSSAALPVWVALLAQAIEDVTQHQQDFSRDALTALLIQAIWCFVFAPLMHCYVFS